MKSKAIKNLISKNYEQALNQFAQLTLTNGDDDYLKLYAAVCNYHLKDHESAYNLLHGFFKNFGFTYFAGKPRKERDKEKKTAAIFLLYYQATSIFLYNKKIDVEYFQIFPVYHSPALTLKILNTVLTGYNEDIFEKYIHEVMTQDFARANNTLLPDTAIDYRQFNFTLKNNIEPFRTGMTRGAIETRSREYYQVLIELAMIYWHSSQDLFLVAADYILNNQINCTFFEVYKMKGDFYIREMQYKKAKECYIEYLKYTDNPEVKGIVKEIDKLYSY